MATISRPAARIQQGQLIIYATSLTVAQLAAPDFYRIDRLDPGARGPGFQRLLEQRRAKRLAEYLLDGATHADAFLPTSLFLATEQPLVFDVERHVVCFDPDVVGPFNVVDGQHRLAGLRLAAERNRHLLEFEVPVNIAASLDLISQMCHFLVVNTTQRSVDRSLSQQIVARLTRLVELEKLPTIPRWIRRQVDRGEDARALQIVSYLNEEPSSHWCGRIRMANDSSRNANLSVHQKTFVESIKKYILASNHPLAALGVDAHKQQRALCNFWNAIIELLVLSHPDAEAGSVVIKSNGVNFFHLTSQTAFHQAASRKDYTQHAFRTILERAFAALPADDMRLGTPEFWLSGHEAGGLNQAALRRLAASLNRAINAGPASHHARL